MGCDLSILCVTRLEPEVIGLLHTLSAVAYRLDTEFVVATDISNGNGRYSTRSWKTLARLDNVVEVESNGYIESVLDEAISYTCGDYVLRLDDDESIPSILFDWLATGEYRSHDNWKFSRAHLWPNEEHYITSSPLYPDHQTRLSIRSKAGSRSTIHSGSPYGGGELAPYPILHHKFLVKTLEQRRDIVRRYESIQKGAGSNFLAFSCPEDYYKDGGMDIAPLPWNNIHKR